MPYQELPHYARVGQEAMAMKGYSAFPKAPALLEPSDCLVSYPGQSLWGGGGAHPSAVVQSVYSTAPADWANQLVDIIVWIYQIIDNDIDIFKSDKKLITKDKFWFSSIDY